MSEWVEVKERLPDTHSDRFQVELASGDKVDAYYYRDAMRWTTYYGKKACHWWHRGSKEPLYNVVKWKEV